MTLPAYMLAATVILPSGAAQDFRPPDQLTQAECLKAARQINAEWHEANIVGFATCHKAGAGQD